MGYFIIEYLGYPCMNLLQIINILGNIQSLNGIWSVFLNYKIWCSQDWFFENVTLVSISSFLSRIFKFEVVTLFRTLLLNYSANFRLVLLLWLFYSQKAIFGNFWNVPGLAFFNEHVLKYKSLWYGNSSFHLYENTYMTNRDLLAGTVQELFPLSDYTEDGPNCYFLYNLSKRVPSFSDSFLFRLGRFVDTFVEIFNKEFSSSWIFTTVRVLSNTKSRQLFRFKSVYA